MRGLASELYGLGVARVCGAVALVYNGRSCRISSCNYKLPAVNFAPRLVSRGTVHMPSSRSKPFAAFGIIIITTRSRIHFYITVGHIAVKPTVIILSVIYIITRITYRSGRASITPSPVIVVIMSCHTNCYLFAGVEGNFRPLSPSPLAGTKIVLSYPGGAYGVCMIYVILTEAINIRKIKMPYNSAAILITIIYGTARCAVKCYAVAVHSAIPHCCIRSGLIGSNKPILVLKRTIDGNFTFAVRNFKTVYSVRKSIVA